MRNPKLVPYETIIRATSGEPEAVDENPRHEACNGELNVKNQKGKAQSRRKRLSQEIFVK